MSPAHPCRAPIIVRIIYLENQGLTIAEMRAISGTFPDFTDVVDVTTVGSPGLTGDFSVAYNYTDNCYPRLKRWVDDGPDDDIGTTDDTYSDDLLPGQGDPATRTGACKAIP